MTITTRDMLIDALANNSSRIVIDKASLANTAAAQFFSLWTATGVPGAGAAPTAAAVPTSATVGALAALHGLTADLIVTSASRTAGGVSQALATDGTSTTVATT